MTESEINRAGASSDALIPWRETARKAQRVLDQLLLDRELLEYEQRKAVAALAASSTERAGHNTKGEAE